MKKTSQTLALLAAVGLAAPVSAQVTVVAGFDRFNDPSIGEMSTGASVVYPGVTATLTVSGTADSEWTRSDNGSNDGTFGLYAGADSSDPSAYFGALTIVSALDQSSYYLDIAISNGSSDSLVLETFAFDVWRNTNDSPPRLDLYVVSGDLTVGYVGQTGFISGRGGPPAAGNSNDYADLNMFNPVQNLADRTLAPGESAVLRLQIWESDWTKGLVDVLSIDNVGVVAVVVPEPSAYTLFSGIAVLGLILLRRRCRQD